MTNLIPLTALQFADNEPRVLDTDLAAWLGFSAARQIRELIARNHDELETYGGLSCGATNPGTQGGRPGKAYYLNEGQSLVLCALSRTQKAAQVRKALIELFQAYRSGKLVEVKAHRRRLPVNRNGANDDFDHINSILQRFVNQPSALIEVLARCVSRLDALENEIS